MWHFCESLLIGRFIVSDGGLSGRPFRTLAARKAYDEPLNVSIQRKAQEKGDVMVQTSR